MSVSCAFWMHDVPSGALLDWIREALSEDERCQGCEDAPVGMTVVHDEGYKEADRG